MGMNLYEAVVPVFTKQLRYLESWLDKAVAYAEQRKFDPETLLVARLAPNQYTLVRQIQAACDQAKFAAALLAGKEPPSHPDTETTLAEIRTRIRAVREYLGGFKPEDFVGAEDRVISRPWMQGKSIRGGDFLDHMVLPNAHFHFTTAYAILRHNGVELGKRDYVNDLPWIS